MLACTAARSFALSLVDGLRFKSLLFVARSTGILGFLPRRRIFRMVRRGWKAVETPSGWFDVIRGPRPPSHQ